MDVKPKHYLAYLVKRHAEHSYLGSSKKARALLVEELMLKTLIDPNSPSFQLLPLGLHALLHLATQGLVTSSAFFP